MSSELSPWRKQCSAQIPLSSNISWASQAAGNSPQTRLGKPDRHVLKLGTPEGRPNCVGIQAALPGFAEAWPCPGSVTACPHAGPATLGPQSPFFPFLDVGESADTLRCPCRSGR